MASQQDVQVSGRLVYSPVDVPALTVPVGRSLIGVRTEADDGASAVGFVRSHASAMALGAMVLLVVCSAVSLYLDGPALEGSASRAATPVPELELEGKAESEATWVQGADFPSHCGPMDIDIEYLDEVSGFGLNYDHIPTPEMCCAMCQGHPRCAAFTWVRDAKLPDGNPSQCWLKGAVGVPRAHPGVVSGAPPKRVELAQCPAHEDSSSGSLFCFCLMVPHSAEEDLVKWQLGAKAGIFGCEGQAVYSNEVTELGPGFSTKLVDSDLKCEYGGDSGTALNAWIFIAVWQKVVQDGDYRQHDWVVKADLDTVFFPHRLGRLLQSHQGASYVSNCKYGLHGPLEVFSTAAIDALAADYALSWDGKAPKQCVEEQDFGLWGEDMFIDQCLGKVLGLSQHPVDSRLMCESHCECPDWYWCLGSSDVVSYHPFKNVDAYKNCMANALLAGI